MKLSPQQAQAMKAMRNGACAYELRVSLATMDALRRKGLVQSHSGLGSSFSPRTSITYSLTEQGKAWQAAHKEAA